VLLEASLEFETLDRIKTIVLSDPRVGELKGPWGRNSGRYRFIEIDLTMKVRDFQKAHRAAEEIKEKIKEGIPFVDHILIHYELMAKEMETTPVHRLTEVSFVLH